MFRGREAGLTPSGMSWRAPRRGKVRSLCAVKGKAMNCSGVRSMLRVLAALIALAAGSLGAAPEALAGPPYPSAYHEIWTSPSLDAAGSMPLGNGQVGINLWAQTNGELRFYVSRTDSFSEASRLLKVGGVRITLAPNPFADGQSFRQELVLRDGVCVITAGAAGQTVTLRVFVDSDRPVVHVQGEALAGVEVRVAIDSWRRESHKAETAELWTMAGAPFELIEAADVFVTSHPDGIGWYHRNESSPAFDATLELQSLRPFADLVPNPLLHRTFGGWLAGTNLAPAENGQVLKSAGPVRAFSLRVAAPCLQPAKAEEWLAVAQGLAAERIDSEAALRSTAGWWNGFWDRSHVITSAEAAGSTLPSNSFPLRVGRDSANGNRFRGEMGRRSVFPWALAEVEVARLAGGAPHDAPPLPGTSIVTADGELEDFPASAVNVARPFTLEAWIRPEAMASMRIFDKLTAGRNDGFLIDVIGKNSLRWIGGDQPLWRSAENVVRLHEWQHVAVVVEPNRATRIYLDGKPAGRVGGRCLPVAQAYALQRYLQACGGRGPLPIKFNGGIFTVEPAAMGQPYNPDYRRWGDPFWWQNTRLPYQPMAASGDLDMTGPLFALYERARPLAEARTALYHGAQGAYFPETMTFWGTYANRDFGWDRSQLEKYEVSCKYWRYAWNQGPELLGLMLDRWDYEQEPEFVRARILPMAESVLKYFDTRFRKDTAGKLVIDPAQSIETYWTGVINDMPTVASLIDATTRLMALPKDLTTPAQRAFFARMKAAVPDLPLEEVTVDNSVRRMLSPAQQYDPKRSNCENPELYAVWPARLVGVGTPLQEEGRLAYERRQSKLPNGWGYDSQVAALLGLTDEAVRVLGIKCANSHPAYRWPATWGPNFDWLPDQDHGSNLLGTVQLMLLQASAGKIHVLPAWPKDWDVSFKLHAPGRTTVECVFRAGTVETLRVSPPSRAGDVILPP